MRIEDIQQSVAEPFGLVNQLIHDKLSSRVPLVHKIAQYIIESGGKRMRPMLVLLCSQALNRCGEDQIRLATIIEFLHTATLLHDDVVDTSDLRRGRATANAQWGNAPSVLVGDFLYSRAFQLMVEIGNMEVMSVLANATNVIAEGEVFQLMNCKNPDISEEVYFEVIQNKTAMLFEASSHAAAILAQTTPGLRTQLKNFGLHLGLAFQLIDDLLDYTGQASVMGKNIGDDLAEGKPTLPLIHALQHCSRTDAELIRSALRKGDKSRIEEICTVVAASGGLDYTHDQALKQRDLALNCLEGLPDSASRTALATLAHLVVERRS
jgi:octaprenyl-diphosphate synthase